ncbi:MAG: hypothetical protein Q8T08_02780, partial [Ignavibacteria bacterium]|nr:hypothetical protein [Ignavibacteria bacterium]
MRKINEIRRNNKKENIMNYWLLGASWGDDDKTEDFVKNKYWENGYDDKFTDVVNSIHENDFVAIKSKYIKKNGLPFDNKEYFVSVTKIKAIGKVIKNHNNGKRIDVEWKSSFEEHEIYGIGFFKTIEIIENSKYISWIFEGNEQDNYNDLSKRYENMNITNCSYFQDTAKANNSQIFAIPILKYLIENNEIFSNRDDIESYLQKQYPHYLEYSKKARLAINQFSQMLTHKVWKNELLKKFVRWQDTALNVINDDGNISTDEIKSGNTKTSYQLIPEKLETISLCMDQIDMDDTNNRINQFIHNEMNKPDPKKSNYDNLGLNTQSLNQILYGPPGTGKTYHTIDKAIEIIDNDFYQQYKVPTPENRIALKNKFDKLKDEGQIVFTTFHQSFGYEEFVEGIKAETENSAISYDIQAGIFKKLCELAKQKSHIKFELQSINFQDYISENQKFKTLTGIEFEVKSVDEKINVQNSQNNIHSLSRKSILDYLEKQDFTNTRGHFSYQPVIAKYIFDKLEKQSLEDNTNKNYILIIDEINRGNISKIFGELITL